MTALIEFIIFLTVLLVFIRVAKIIIKNKK